MMLVSNARFVNFDLGPIESRVGNVEKRCGAKMCQRSLKNAWLNLVQTRGDGFHHKKDRGGLHENCDEVEFKTDFYSNGRTKQDGEKD